MFEEGEEGAGVGGTGDILNFLTQAYSRNGADLDNSGLRRRERRREGEGFGRVEVLHSDGLTGKFCKRFLGGIISTVLWHLVE